MTDQHIYDVRMPNGAAVILWDGTTAHIVSDTATTAPPITSLVGRAVAVTRLRAVADLLDTITPHSDEDRAPDSQLWQLQTREGNAWVPRSDWVEWNHAAHILRRNETQYPGQPWRITPDPGATL